MVTRIRKTVKPRLFLKEHRETKGLTAEAMGGRLGIERESVYRLERESWRVKPTTQAAYADALGLEPEDLWHPPNRPSLDALVKNVPDDLRSTAVDIVRRLVGRN